jgi:D-glycero-alpha-D-manno-heptose-7-phosphate kinase
MIISRAPLRVSFFGGGTDFPEYFRKHGGAVMATAVDKYSYVTASQFHSRLFDHTVRLSYSHSELAKSLDELRHPVFRECLRFCGLDRDIELHTVADLPSFTGLGSSSSFAVALLNALHAYKGEFRRPIELAYEAIHIERGVLKEMVGVQDQTIAAVGGFNVLEFRSESDIRVSRVVLKPSRLSELESHLFVIYTGIKRRASEIEGAKFARIGEKTKTLHRIRAMVDEAHAELSSARSLEKFGKLLHETWLAKQSLSALVNNDRINELYQAGLGAGAWGGKLLGAGGGGFLLFCAPPEKHGPLLAAFNGLYQLKLSLDAPGAQILYA